METASSPKRIRVLGVFDIDLPTASLWFVLFNIVLAVGAALVLFGTIGVFVTGGVKERFGDERIAQNEADTARAKESAALADERAAEANKAAETERVERLKLEARLAPRSLSDAAQQRIALAILPFAGQEFEFTSFQDDPEVVGLVHQLVALLVKSARWHGHNASSFLLASYDVGVAIWYRPEKRSEFGPAAAALAAALSEEGIAATATADARLDQTWNNRLMIRVGKKP